MENPAVLDKKRTTALLKLQAMAALVGVLATLTAQYLAETFDDEGSGIGWLVVPLWMALTEPTAGLSRALGHPWNLQSVHGVRGARLLASCAVTAASFAAAPTLLWLLARGLRSAVREQDNR